MATNLRLVAEDAAQRPTPTLSDVDASRALAEFHREIAAQLPTSSPTRAMVLRCGAHWAGIAGSRRLAFAAAPFAGRGGDR
jgi:hypothetical protein